MEFFFISLFRVVNDADFIKYAGLQVTGILLAIIGNIQQFNALLVTAVHCFSILSLIAGIILVYYKVKAIRSELSKK